MARQCSEQDFEAVTLTAGTTVVNCKNLKAKTDTLFVAIAELDPETGSWSSNGTSSGLAESLVKGDVTPPGKRYKSVTVTSGSLYGEKVAPRPL